MISTFRTLAKLAFAVIAITVCLPAAPSRAQSVAYMSATGSGSACTAAAPCGFFSAAKDVAQSTSNGRIICLSSVNSTFPNATEPMGGNITLEIDCPEGIGLLALSWSISNSSAKIRNVTFTTIGAISAIFYQSNGTLIFENCIFEGSTITSLDIEPTGSLNLVIRNSRISNNGGGGIFLKPAAGGSIHATLDHVTIANNSGGGLKIDTTNGPVTVDITDSVVSDNAGNGINAVGNAGGQTMVSIKSSVIAKNGAAGVQANGANAGVLVQTTLFDQNAAGATSVVGAGHISTYGNNSIVGSSGSGFTGSALLQ